MEMIAGCVDVSELDGGVWLEVYNYSTSGGVRLSLEDAEKLRDALTRLIASTPPRSQEKE